MTHEPDNPTTDVARDDPPPPAPVPWLTPTRSIQLMLSVLVVLLGTAALWLGKAVLIPMTAALLLALLCKPMVRWLTSWGLWLHAAAGMVVGAMALAMIAGLWMVAAPAMQWMEHAPQTLQRVEQRVRELRRPMQKITEAGEKLDQIAGDGEWVQKVEVAAEGFPLVDRSLQIAGSIVVVLVLCYFLLVYWDDFLLNAVRAVPRLNERKELVSAVREAERDVSHFLLVRTVINVGLGLALWPVFYAIGLPNPALWATVGAVANFVPYVGAFAAFVLICLVSMVEFEAWGAVALAPAAFAVLTTVEGFIISPLAFGRGLKLNPVVVFVGLLFWGWLWGIMGALMAVPLLVFARVICAHFEPLRPIGRLMEASRSDDGVGTPIGEPSPAAYAAGAESATGAAPAPAPTTATG